MTEKRKYRCAACKKEFEAKEKDRASICPGCRSRTLILLEGRPRKRKATPAPSG